MEREYLRSSSILGGMEHEYEELESLGYVTIHTENVQHYAVLTPMGRLKLQELHNA
jgi:hypothetical protein